MASRNGRRGNRYPWRRKAKKESSSGRKSTGERRRPSCCTRRRTPGPGVSPPLGVGLWKPSTKSMSEVLTELVLARCPQASACIPCLLQTALDVMMTLPPDLILLGKLLGATQASAPDWPLESLTKWVKRMQLSRAHVCGDACCGLQNVLEPSWCVVS